MPKGPAAQAKLKSLGFNNVEESLGERFHASPELLKLLNPGADLSKAGNRIQVPNIAPSALPKAAKVVVDKSDSTLQLLDAQGKVIAQVPVSSGSQHDPLPIGEWKILGVYRDPPFHYNPKLFWDARKGEKKATLPPGPNNPVGRVWIDLSATLRPAWHARARACRQDRVTWLRAHDQLGCTARGRRSRQLGTRADAGVNRCAFLS